MITAEQSQLTGSVDASQILQLWVVAANAVQINNFFTGFVTTGGPGVNTLSLRGLGAQRTLFLLNGERMGPAGVGGTVGPVDLNTIPSSMVDHIDILKDGASSIYGSDAIAGVVNVITGKTNQDGGDLHVVGDASQAGGGNSYQVNGSYGKTFDRGYFTVGFDYYRQDPLTVGQRSYLNCARDLAVDATTHAPVDIIDPATGQDKCNNSGDLAKGIVDVGSRTTGFQTLHSQRPWRSLGGGSGLGQPTLAGRGAAVLRRHADALPRRHVAGDESGGDPRFPGAGARQRSPAQPGDRDLSGQPLHPDSLRRLRHHAARSPLRQRAAEPARFQPGTDRPVLHRNPEPRPIPSTLRAANGCSSFRSPFSNRTPPRPRPSTTGASSWA